jgi:hypothetical protein
MDQNTHIIDPPCAIISIHTLHDEEKGKVKFPRVSHSSAFITQLIACRLNVSDYRLKNRKQSQGASHLYRESVQHLTQAGLKKNTVIDRV